MVLQVKEQQSVRNHKFETYEQKLRNSFRLHWEFDEQTKDKNKRKEQQQHSEVQQNQVQKGAKETWLKNLLKMMFIRNLWKKWKDFCEK